MKYKKIGPCKVLRKFSANAYEIQLPPGIGISPIFNLAYLFPFTANPDEKGEDGIAQPTRNTQDEGEAWKRQMPYVQPPEIERILDTQVVKRTRRRSMCNTWSSGRTILLRTVRGLMLGKLNKHGLQSRSSWTRAMIYFYPGSLMQEHPSHHDRVKSLPGWKVV